MLVVDLGGQYSQLIARRVREARVYSELVGHRSSAAALRARNPAALILSGGPASVYAEDAPQVDPGIYELGVPVLGICYGMQLMAQDLGGRVERDGRVRVRQDRRSGWRGALGRGPAGGADGLDEPPRLRDRAARRARRSPPAPPSTPIAAFEAPERGLYGVQFHPEVVHTPHGQEVLKNFLYGVAGARPTWTPAAVIEEQVERIRAQVGNERVLCALSGGVDSAVAALLVHKAVGDQLTCVFVDHGLLRKDEAAQVVETFEGHFHVPLVHVDAADAVPRAARGRHRARGEAARSSARSSSASSRRRRTKLGAHTLPRPGHALLRRDRVGRHRGRRRQDQVAPQRRRAARRHDDGARRAAARRCSRTRCGAWGRSSACRRRWSGGTRSPGPGLAIRIIGEVTRERLEILREADAILLEEVRRAGLYRELWQCFAVLPAIRSVGVQGDERTYGYPIVIRAVTSEDAMTADWARLPYDLLETISSRIVNEIPGVNRVALDLSSKPPATIEWE